MLSLQRQLTEQKEKVIQAESKLCSEKKKFKDLHHIQQNKNVKDLIKLKQELQEQRKGIYCF